MPPLLEPYDDNIKQTYYDMEYEVFMQMLINRNTNECRSTYFPHNAWTVYDPTVLRIGFSSDMNKVKKALEPLKDEKYIDIFSELSQLMPYRYLVGREGFCIEKQ